MGAEKFEEFNEAIIHKAESLKPKRKRIIKEPDGDRNNPNTGKQPGTTSKKTKGSSSNKDLPNQGKLKLDASVANQYITYPTDLKLLNTARQETERLIDILYKKLDYDIKPRTYRRNARKEYLVVSKKRHKNKKELRVIIGKQLRYVRRNISTIEKMLNDIEQLGKDFPLKHRDQRIYWVVQHLFAQQMYMYRNKTHKCSDRIVNIYQPHVRPIVRGKDGADVEFGPKMNISEVEGFTRCNHIGWDNYDEGGDLEQQLEDFKGVYGCYPELLLVDRRYLTLKNRQYLKNMGIRIVGKPLGRPPKEQLSGYQKYKTRKERNMRNHVEGKFGQGKNGYNLNKIRARRRDTSESWISSILFVMNLIKLMEVAIKYGNFLFLFFFWLMRGDFSPSAVYEWIPVDKRRTRLR
jgi:hypothetical protein